MFGIRVNSGAFIPRNRGNTIPYYEDGLNVFIKVRCPQKV